MPQPGSTIATQPTSLAAAIEADLAALTTLTGDACLWLDTHGNVRRALGRWPATSDGPVAMLGRKLTELVPVEIADTLLSRGKQAVCRLWAVTSGGVRHDYELRALLVPGNRWLLVARELTPIADAILSAECARLRAQVHDLEQRLRRAHDDREMFRARLNEEVERAARRADPVSVLRLELHDLRAYSQRFGDDASVTVLGTVDQALRRGARAGDFLARWDERGFAMLLPNTDAQAARSVAERHQRGIGAISWPHDEFDVRVGLATLWRDANDPDELLRKSTPVH